MKLRLLSFLVLLALPLPSAHGAHAGDWGSTGGGEFIRDQYNPWFVKSTKDVAYCIEVDHAGFSAPAEKVAALVAEALAYWRGQLASRAADLGVATQNFTLKPACDGSEDLALQFGFGTLKPDQLKYFADSSEDPQDYVGIAIRTSYDKQNLKGKGFVFISSDKGEFLYNHGQGVTRELWAYDGLLFRILQHELGHVFGVSHTDDGFMAAYFPESMVSNYRRFRTIESRPFFGPLPTFDSCVEAGMGSATCLHGETTDDWTTFSLSRVDENRHLVTIGNVSDGSRSSTRLTFPLKVFLPKEQNVFNEPPGRLTLMGPARQEFKVTGTLTTTSGEKKPLLLELRPESVEVFFDDGKGFKRQ